jgi:hypothetical protein
VVSAERGAHHPGDHGKPALTDWEVEARGDGCTRLALTPHTGRTHRLRVHCAVGLVRRSAATSGCLEAIKRRALRRRYLEELDNQRTALAVPDELPLLAGERCRLADGLVP